jgi:pimeloyl-ACP methyl ester carboxylesterase
VPQGFRRDVAAELANLIVAAYDQFKPPVGRPTRWPLSSPYELVASFSARLPFHDTETFGFVARRSDSRDVYVVFRGTESPDDWLANIELRHVPQQHGWGRVEEGFDRVYAQCSQVIVAAIRDSGADQVLVAGHSLGGALATLSAADLKATLNVNSTVYTLASPRVGDVAFADRFNAECPGLWRVVNTEDVITTVPVATTAFESAHLTIVARLVRLLVRLPIVGRWVRRRLGWMRTLFSDDVYEHVGIPVDFTRNNGTVLANHIMATYMAAIGASANDPLGAGSALVGTPH